MADEILLVVHFCLYTNFRVSHQALSRSDVVDWSPGTAASLQQPVSVHVSVGRSPLLSEFASIDRNQIEFRFDDVIRGEIYQQVAAETAGIFEGSSFTLDNVTDCSMIVRNDSTASVAITFRFDTATLLHTYMPSLDERSWSCVDRFSWIVSEKIGNRWIPAFEKLLLQAASQLNVRAGELYLSVIPDFMPRGSIKRSFWVFDRIILLPNPKSLLFPRSMRDRGADFNVSEESRLGGVRLLDHMGLSTIWSTIDHVSFHDVEKSLRYLVEYDALFLGPRAVRDRVKEVLSEYSSVWSDRDSMGDKVVAVRRFIARADLALHQLKETVDWSSDVVGRCYLYRSRYSGEAEQINSYNRFVEQVVVYISNEESRAESIRAKAIEFFVASIGVVSVGSFFTEMVIFVLGEQVSRIGLRWRLLVAACVFGIMIWIGGWLYRKSRRIS